MRTHENADTDENQMDFCWGVPHENLHNCYSSTIINATPQQAFVAGYREGVKMSTEKGKPISAKNYYRSIWKNNLNILSTWCTIGADIENGKYAMLGARMGCFYTVIEPNNEFFKIRDLDQMQNYFNEVNPKRNIDDRKFIRSIGSAVMKLQFDAEKMSIKDRDNHIISKLSSIEGKGAF